MEVISKLLLVVAGLACLVARVLEQISIILRKTGAFFTRIGGIK